MKKGFDIYNHERQLRRYIAHVKESPISEKNINIILKFRESCVLEGIGIARMIRYLDVLRQWAMILNIDFDKAGKENIRRAVRVVEEKQDYSPWTKATYKTMLKRFFKWLKETGDEYPDEVKWIKTKIKATEKKHPTEDNLLTEDEIKLLIEKAGHPRDKAFVSLLYESGARIGEIATLQIGNVTFDKHGAVIQVTGKTGPRPVRVIFSVPHIMSWINSHPFKDEPAHALWINIGSRNHNQTASYASLRKMLKDLFSKAGLKKRFNPHFFRHSRATFLANYLTEFQMNQYFGWIQGSDMPSTYVHMSGKSLDKSILALNGIKQEQGTAESCLSPKICPRCDTVNASSSKFCTKCAGLLDVKTALEIQHKTEIERKENASTNRIMETLMKDKEFKDLLMRKACELGLSGNIS